MDSASPLKMCASAHDVTSDFKVFEKIHLYSVQVQTKGFYFTEAPLFNLQKCNLKLSSFLA